MKIILNRKRFVLSVLLSITIVLCLLPSLAFAATDIHFTTNGAGNYYAADSIIVVYGLVENDGIGVPKTSVLVEASINGTKFYYKQAVTDKDGYFRAGFNIPSNTNKGDILEITANGNTNKLDYTLYSKEEISNGTVTDKFELLGFITTTPGSLTSPAINKIPATTEELGLMFSKNANYFNNKDQDLDIDSLGVNTKNEDCFTLYNNSTNKKIPISIDLLESDDSGGSDNSVKEYTDLDGNLVDNDEARIEKPNRDKDLILISIPDGLEAGTTYRLEVDGDLSSNSGATLGDDLDVFFTTASAGSGGTSGGSSSGSTIDTADEEIIVSSTPTISGDKGTVKPTDSQISSAIESMEDDQDYILTFKVSEDDAEDVNELVLQLTSAQVEDLTDADAKIAYDTPLGVVVLPQEVLGQVSGTLTLAITKAADSDTFTVTLKDGSTTISILSGRLKLELPVSISGAATDVLTHNGAIMKNSLIDDGTAYGSTENFSTFAVSSVDVNFSDITSHWGKDYIEFLAARNIINGVGDNTFAPNNKVTRAEFVKMLVNSIDGLSVDSAAASGLSDVKAGQWYSDYVNWAKANGIVTGYVDGTFGINKTISRQEMAVIISRFAAKEGINLTAVNSKVAFADNSSIASFAKDAVSDMQQAGIINGMGNNLFKPIDNATRAEAAKMIYKMIEILVKQ